MAAVRRGAWVALRYVTLAFFLGVIVQFFLVGYGLFGMKDGNTIDNANSLDAHRGFGFILADFHHKWVGMFHPVVALLLLALSGRLAHYAWTSRKSKDAAAAPAAAPSG